MSVAKSLSNTVRSALVAAGLGAATATMLAAVVLPGWAQKRRSPRRRHIDRQFHLHAGDADGEGRHHGDLDQQGRHPARHRLGKQRLRQIEGARHRRQLFVHVYHARHLPILLLRSSAHDRHDRGRTKQRLSDAHAAMLDRLRSEAPKVLWTAERDTMTGDANAEQEKARRFRDAALPYLDDVFALARYLMRNAADAEDAVQECYLRALRHFDSYRGPAMKPWLLGDIEERLQRRVRAARQARDVRPITPTTSRRRKSRRCGRSRQRSPEAALLRQPGRRRRSAASSPRCRSRSAKPSCCARSTNCRIRRSPRSPACRWER